MARLERQGLTTEFSKAHGRTLVVWGMDYWFSALEFGLLMTCTFQNAEMRIFSKCGRWTPVEQAANLNQLILAFPGRDS